MNQTTYARVDPQIGISYPVDLRVTLQPDGTVLWGATADVSGEGSGPTGSTAGPTPQEALWQLGASLAMHAPRLVEEETPA